MHAGGSAAVCCTSALSLAKGTGTAASPGISPAVYSRKQADVVRLPVKSGGTLGVCAGVLASSTTTKEAGATVLGTLISMTDPCTGWVQPSTSTSASGGGGKSRTAVSPVVSFKAPVTRGRLRSSPRASPTARALSRGSASRT